MREDERYLTPEERLEAYVDGELPEAEAVELERRLESSESLRRQLNLARQVRRALRDLPSFDAAPETLERVRRQTTGVVSEVGEVSEVGVGDLVGDRSGAVRGFRYRWAIAAALATFAVGLFTWKTLDQTRTADLEVVKAAEETRWVLAQVDRLTRKAGRTVRDEVVAKYVVAPTRRGVETALDFPRPSSDDGSELQERDDA